MHIYLYMSDGSVAEIDNAKKDWWSPNRILVNDFGSIQAKGRDLYVRTAHIVAYLVEE